MRWKIEIFVSFGTFGILYTEDSSGGWYHTVWYSPAHYFFLNPDDVNAKALTKLSRRRHRNKIIDTILTTSRASSMPKQKWQQTIQLPTLDWNAKYFHHYKYKGFALRIGEAWALVSII
jgi:hypothetical protein